MQTSGLLVPGLTIALGAWLSRTVLPRTGWRAALAPRLAPLAAAAGLDLEYLLGWIAVESGGSIGRPGDVSPLGEAGYFQIYPGELPGVDMARLNEDPEYSLEKGVALVVQYRDVVRGWGWPPPGVLFWACVKLCHTFGAGTAQAFVFASGWRGTTWSSLRAFLRAHAAELAPRADVTAAAFLMHVANVDRVLAGG